MVYVHKAASPQTVKIIKNIMRCAGVHRFAPDFLNPPKAPSNQLLWDSAVKAFTELLAEQQLAVASQIEGLTDLYPSIRAACSDDETDYKEQPLRNLKQGRKHFKILQVPWRSKAFSEFLLLLDDIGERQKQASFCKPSGPPPRVRHREDNPATGLVQPKSNLPKDVFNSGWLKSLSQDKRRGLQVQPPHNLK
ncbi:hypothetical protein PCANC_15242 [Puccinia coronata f. sp. avenae]|uniref:Uncharacterized protein n=1 Tax=Puccinia coronata f. sp. avenae TaxID=200324 RepID=A0A2N5VNH4_9BASI|nr:hypothetical protein PCANC_15242 [Puccinia coronata f. sp. avenae]